MLWLHCTLQVGGPATCCADCWLTDFVRHMDNASVPYDFISTHAYSSCQVTGDSRGWAVGWGGGGGWGGGWVGGGVWGWGGRQVGAREG
jgi:hypothetical protein